MTLFVYIGKIGSGKTLSAVRHCYASYLKGRQVWSNIPLGFKHTIITTEQYDSWSQEDTQFNDAVLLLDEGYLMQDSRRSMSKRNIANTLFILQSRKKHVDVIFTSQHFGQLDNRVRNNVHAKIDCEYKANVDGKGLCLVKNSWYTPNNAGQFVKRGVRIFAANPYFSLYDTNRIVMPGKG